MWEEWKILSLIRICFSLSNFSNPFWGDVSRFFDVIPLIRLFFAFLGGCFRRISLLLFSDNYSSGKGGKVFFAIFNSLVTARISGRENIDIEIRQSGRHFHSLRHLFCSHAFHASKVQSGEIIYSANRKKNQQKNRDKWSTQVEGTHKSFTSLCVIL
jgi:hypothetical protein